MDIAPHWQVLLKEENQRLVLRNVRTLCLIAMTLVPLCTVLDIFSYPDYWAHFFLIRASASIVEILLLALTYTSFGKKNQRTLMLLVPLVPLTTIAWMIRETGDPASPYYAGLSLCLVGVGLLFQWSYFESIIAVVITLALYLAATIPNLAGVTSHTSLFGQFVNNGIFVALTGVIITTGSLVHQRIRENEIISRYRLADSRKELEEKHQQLVEMDRLKTDFFSNVTHELRTPLTLMLAPLQRLLRNTAKSSAGASSDAEEMREEIGGIYQNGLRLLRLINELLNLSSADAGRLRIDHRDFDFNEFLNHVIHSIRNMAEQGGVSVNQQATLPLTTVRGDKDKLEKILLNLLFNAVKFTPSGGRVTLAFQKFGTEVVFEVSDTGVGIPARSLPFIFDRFWQADTSITRRHAGTGLGLSLVKEFAEAMGGRVEAKSKVGVGTIIRVVLPLQIKQDIPVIGFEAADSCSPPAAAEDTSEHSPTSAAWIRSIYREADQAYTDHSDKTEPGAETPSPDEGAPLAEDRSHLPLVLVADDEPGMLRLIRRELGANFRILQTADGSAALKAAMKHRPDLVIADYMMPNLDGLALCRELRNQEEFRLVPVMLMTARSDEEVRLNALHHGANDVLVKPFSISEFNSRVRNLVENHLLQKQVESRNFELQNTIRELRATERELVQSEKMAALGILTGGIMHEINNPLNFARSALYVLDRRAAKLAESQGGDLSNIIADLREGISRIGTIVSELRTFCHPETLIAASCPITEPLQSAVRLLAAPMRESSVVLEENVPETLTVRGDKNQLTLVFLNLLKNALDALSTTTINSGDQRHIRVSARAEGQDHVEVSVTDNGPGIPEENLTHVFDPFFTTKAPGEGTGLGLSICYRIISAHGGAITANSQPGQGTQFTIRLTRVTPDLRPSPAKLPALNA